jgi:hypothetical protein
MHFRITKTLEKAMRNSYHFGNTVGAKVTELRRGSVNNVSIGGNGHSPDCAARRHRQRDGGADRSGDARGLIILKFDPLTRWITLWKSMRPVSPSSEIL